MANYNKQIEKWMSKASFDKLDLSTIPEGTEINIVGDIVESDLSLELRNKINNAGGHCWKLEVDTGDMYGKFAFYVNTIATNLTDLASDIINRHCISGFMIIPEGAWNTNAYYGMATAYVSAISVSGSNLTISLSMVFTYSVVGNSVIGDNDRTAGYDMSNATATATQIF